MIRLCSLCSIAFVAALALQAAAEDLNPPPWDQSLPNQTSQIWEATPLGEPGTNISGMVLWPQINPLYMNPFGEASATLAGTWDYEVIDGPKEGQGPIPTWHVGEPGGSLVIKIPNNPNGGDVKQVFWQITSDKSVTPQGSPPTSNPPGTASTPYPHVQWPVGTWYTYNGLLTIRPNPASETITFDLVPSTNISEIVVKTVCISVPEPGTLALLGMAAVGLLAYAWRRRV